MVARHPLRQRLSNIADKSHKTATPRTVSEETKSKTPPDSAVVGIDGAAPCSIFLGLSMLPGDTDKGKGEDVMNEPGPKCNEPNAVLLAAIQTYNDMEYQEEYLQFVKKASVLFSEIMRDEVNAQDECEKFLRAYAPKVLNAHYP